MDRLLEEVETQTEPRPFQEAADLDGSVAIVTGGSMGIGRAVGIALARAGVHIAFNYLDSDIDAGQTALETAEEIEACGVHVFHRPVDCTRSDEVASFVQETIERMEGLQILVNNAGVSRQRGLTVTSDEDWQLVLRTNLSGAFYFIRAVAPTFQEQEFGKIVNVSSIHGFRSEWGLAGLSASKAGIAALTRSAALELGPANVNVNAVAPGYIRTTRLTQEVSAETIDRVREQSALRRLGDPHDVAGAVLFLCSEAARHITGAILPVDGGYLI